MTLWTCVCELSFRKTQETPLFRYNTQKMKLSRPLNCNHSPKTTWSSRRWARRLVNYPGTEQLYLKNFILTSKKANHSIENLTNDGELQTCAGQLLLTTSNSLENLVTSNPQHCDREKETEFEICSVKQNTVEEFEFEFECGRCGKKSQQSTWRVTFLSSKPQLVQDLQYVILLLFHSLSMGNISKITTKFSGLLSTFGLDYVSSTQWIHIVEWIASFVTPFVLERARSKNWSSLKWR